jgi:hypothetical protein
MVKMKSEAETGPTVWCGVRCVACEGGGGEGRGTRADAWGAAGARGSSDGGRRGSGYLHNARFTEIDISIMLISYQHKSI